MRVVKARPKQKLLGFNKHGKPRMVIQSKFERNYEIDQAAKRKTKKKKDT